MGIITHGILGDCTGKVGNLVYYKLNGKTVVRAVGEITKPASKKQLAVRQKMTVTTQMLCLIRDFINEGFCTEAARAKKQPYNFALAYHLKNALTGLYPNTAIDYGKVLVTMGKLKTAENPAVERVERGLRFTWEIDARMPWPENTDRVMVLAYFPVRKDAVYLTAGASRIAGEQFLKLPDGLQNEHMELYISFAAENRKKVANSIYLGSLTKIDR